jgi:hypothetical protein
MSIEALVSGVLLKGVSKLATSMFHRTEKTPDSQDLTKKNDSHDVSDKGARIDSVFNYYQKQLYAQLQPPYIDGAVEHNQGVLEELSEALATRLNAMGQKADRGRLIEQLENSMADLTVEEGRSLGNPFQSGIWSLLGGQERAMLTTAYNDARSGKDSMKSVHELALAMRRDFMA